MKELRDLAGKFVTVLTTQTPLLMKVPVYDDEGNESGEFQETINEDHPYTIEGEVKHLTSNGWLVIDLEYRSNIYTYFIALDKVVHILHSERTPEAQARDAERAKSLAASRSKSKPRQAK